MGPDLGRLAYYSSLIARGRISAVIFPKNAGGPIP